MRHAWGHKLQRFRLEWPFCLFSILCLYNHKQPGMGTVWTLRSVEQHFSTLCAVPQSAILKLYPFRTTCDTTCTFRKTFKLSKSSTHWQNYTTKIRCFKAFIQAELVSDNEAFAWNAEPYCIVKVISIIFTSFWCHALPQKRKTDVM